MCHSQIRCRGLVSMYREGAKCICDLLQCYYTLLGFLGPARSLKEGSRREQPKTGQQVRAISHIQHLGQFN